MLDPLGADRPHTLKIFGSYDLKSKIGNTDLGLTQAAYSGSPNSTTVIYLSALTFPNGRGGMGRTPVCTRTGLAVSHTFPIGEKAKAKFEVQVRNLFNQAAMIQRVTQIDRAGAIPEAKLPVAQFFKGYTLSNFVSPANAAGNPQYQPIYGLPAANYRNGGGPGTTYSSAWSTTTPNFGGYQDFRAPRLGLRFIF